MTCDHNVAAPQATLVPPNPGDPEEPGTPVGAACQGAQSCPLLPQTHELLHCPSPGP